MINLNLGLPMILLMWAFFLYILKYNTFYTLIIYFVEMKNLKYAGILKNAVFVQSR